MDSISFKLSIYLNLSYQLDILYAYIDHNVLNIDHQTKPNKTKHKPNKNKQIQTKPNQIKPNLPWLHEDSKADLGPRDPNSLSLFLREYHYPYVHCRTILTHFYP